MFGKKKLAVLLAAVVALTTVTGAGVASAHGGGGFGGEYADSIRERAAEILGIEPADLQDALQTARAEAARAQLVERLSAAVEDGTITKADMNEMLAWVDARPDAVDEIAPGPHIGIIPLRAEGIEARLDALVEAGTITQDKSDEISAWLDAAPEAVSDVAPASGCLGGHFGRGHRGHGHGFRHMPAPEASDSGTSTSTSYSGTAA